MTVRGVFYALEGQGIVPKDDTRGYRPVQRQVLVMRRKGLLPWGFIADGTRWMRRATTYDDAEDALRRIAANYREDLWRSQKLRLLWLEKDALADLVFPVADSWGVPLAVSRGVPSATYVYNAASDAAHAFAEVEQVTLALCLYDLDAGGARAFRAVQRGFEEYSGGAARARLLALTDDQAANWALPTRPPKSKDPEAKKWGSRPCVELDAIPPDVLWLVDDRAWKIAQAAEESERGIFLRLVEGIGADQ